MKNTRQFQYSMNNSIRYKTSRYEISHVNWWTAQPQVMIWAGKEWIKRNPWRSSWSKWWLTKPLNMIIWSSIMIKYHVWKLYVSLCYLPFFFFFIVFTTRLSRIVLRCKTYLKTQTYSIYLPAGFRRLHWESKWVIDFVRNCHLSTTFRNLTVFASLHLEGWWYFVSIFCLMWMDRIDV